ncbi:MAG: cbb3-type cytochrome c oxidase subunit I, partial [bacterium]
MNAYHRLWAGLIIVIIGSFAVLGWSGYEIYMKAPPIPTAVVAAGQQPLYTGEQIQNGQNVWQSMGGQQVGSIWGHGAYVAPDWSADYLHREAVALLDLWALRDHGVAFDALTLERQAALQARLTSEMRANTYDPSTGTVTVSADRATVIQGLAAYYDGLFGDAAADTQLRSDYAMAANVVPDAARRAELGAFFFWAAWACSTNRPDAAITYTNNWPHEPLIGNQPTSSLILWTGVSLVLLLIGIAALASYFAVQKRRTQEEPEVPQTDPLQALTPTPSMRATLKYFWVVAALMLVQILMGVLTAHYGVEGTGFYGIPIAEWLPYSITRTWHTQLAIFWIATAWLATGLFIAPAVGGHEPPYQAVGVNFLFVCLLIIVVGSFAGEWMGVQQKLGNLQNFWFGHQGYEYVDLGRFWQIFLLIGLFLWLALVARALWPAFSRPAESRGLLALFVVSATAIAGFYGAGLMWGQHTNLAIAEYWRWWVVHLWVEGFFEVFATVVIAFLFARLGLLEPKSTERAVVVSSTIFLTGGIVGTLHHLYYSGTPSIVAAMGSVFSALEVVPLVFIGYEAWDNFRLSRHR